MRVKFTLVVPFILASAVYGVQAWPKAKTITADTTSGRLLGTQAGGGAHILNLLLTKMTCCTSRII
jgi:hypothetical protein